MTINDEKDSMCCSTIVSKIRTIIGNYMDFMNLIYMTRPTKGIDKTSNKRSFFHKCHHVKSWTINIGKKCTFIDRITGWCRFYDNARQFQKYSMTSRVRQYWRQMPFRPWTKVGLFFRALLWPNQWSHKQPMGTKWKIWTISFHWDPMVYCTSNSLAVTAC